MPQHPVELRVEDELADQPAAVERVSGHVGVLVIAPGFGGSIPLRAAIYADYFGISVLGRVLGIGRLVSTTGGAIGAWVLGVVIDGSGYPNAWWLAFGLAALAVPTSLFATPPTGLQQEYALAGDGADDADQPNG